MTTRFVNCPHCDILIEVLELNCCIFRCGIYKKQNQGSAPPFEYIQIPPHSTKEECDRLIKNNEIYGCGKPFRIIVASSGYIVEICDYL